LQVAVHSIRLLSIYPVNVSRVVDTSSNNPRAVNLANTFRLAFVTHFKAIYSVEILYKIMKISTLSMVHISVEVI